MAKKITRPKPTDAELEILRVLWKRGPSTVRQVQEELRSTKVAGYTTVLKLLQIMTAKGLVARNESSRTHIYQPRWAEEQTQRQLVSDLMQRAFGGAADKLVLQALSAKRVSSTELAEIRRLLDQLEREGK